MKARRYKWTVSLFLLLIVSGFALILWWAISQDGPSQATSAPEPLVTVSEAPSPSPTTSLSPEPKNNPDTVDYLVIYDYTFDIVEWDLKAALDSWDIPVAKITMATGGQCDTFNYDVCVKISATNGGLYYDGDEPADALSEKISSSYYEIVLDSSAYFGENYTRQGLICHEIGHVLGLEHTDYPSCMHAYEKFITWPAVYDLAILNSSDWKPGKW